ncbi:MAG: hypothetical protein IPI58_09750 [Alphaproteobacteria bacterium]|nr:MAG: hypothetical protein IPI58_09750 [Alphaproteobacteria bacterium]
MFWRIFDLISTPVMIACLPLGVWLNWDIGKLAIQSSSIETLVMAVVLTLALFFWVWAYFTSPKPAPTQIKTEGAE